MENSINSTTRLRATQLLCIIIVLLTSAWQYAEAITAIQELVKGFKAAPNPSVTAFQSLLNDSTGNFSFGFLRVNQVQLTLTVIHLPSLEPLWQVNPASSARWSDQTQLFFNGSLVFSDAQSGLFWSTGTRGDKVVLLNTSNLQIINLESSPSVVWQSFDFPGDTLVENQNLTSDLSMVSSNGLYSLRLEDNFMALYAKFKEENADQIYWKHDALEARAVIVEGNGPLYARVDSDGFLGMYQTEKAPVDIQAFNSYHRPISRFLLLRLETDGNLKGYFWNGLGWVLDYQAISVPDMCQLPDPCGSYGMCTPGSGCSCLDNRTEHSSGECMAVPSGDFCSDEAQNDNDFWVLRKDGVDLPFKELMGYKTVSSWEQCELLCESNCSCWGTVYNNGSGFCYFLDYPIRTLLGVSDESKVGYFKVRKGTGKKNEKKIGIGVGILSGACIILIGAIGFGSYRIWRRRRGVKGLLEEEDGISPGPYKDLGSASFKSIEMSSR